MSKFTSEQDQKRRAEWAKIEASIQASSPKEHALEWGRLREEFYAEGGPLEVPKPDLDRLSSLKNKYKGKRIFILGNGPSLNRTSLEFLKNEYTFGVNRIYLLDDKVSWKPSFYTANDWRVVPDIALEINGLTGSTFFFEESFRGILREGSDTYFYRHSAADPNHPNERIFGHEATRGIRGAGSVVGTAVQLAAYMGFDPIYLIGCDLGYKVLETVEQTGEDKFGNGVKLFLTSTKDDDPNHFDTRYFGKGQRWHDPNVKRMISGHEQCKAGIEAKGGHIYNATVGGELEVYPRVKFDSLFPVQSYPGNTRDDGASLDETELVSKLFEDDKNPKVMLDVGAHRGTSAKYFKGDDWRIFCFEPDPKNREGLKKHSKIQANIEKIDPRAVGPVPEKGQKFYGSDESSGISGMLAFRDTHKVIATVDVTTVSEIMKENNISQIDFLKIDVEGFDLGVLKGVPWRDIKPDVIECEYEDAKTKLLGHTWRDICEYLRARHYTIYISEWHPIVRYGVPHDWHTIKKYPCELSDEQSWGNLLAFKKDPGEKAVIDAMKKVMRHRNKTVPKNAAPESIGPKTTQPPTLAIQNVNEVKATAGQVGNDNRRASEDLAVGSVAASTGMNTTNTSNPPNSNSIYKNRFRDRFRTKSPALFRIAQLGLWGLRFAKRHYLLASVSIVTLGALVLAPVFSEAVAPYALYSWALAATLVAAGSTLLLSAFVNMMANRIAEREIQARKNLREDLLKTLRQEHVAKGLEVDQSIERTKQQTTNSILSNIDQRFEDYVAPRLANQESKLAAQLSELEKTHEHSLLQNEKNLTSFITDRSTLTQAQLLEDKQNFLNTIHNLEKRLEEQREEENRELRDKLENLLVNLDSRLSAKIQESKAQVTTQSKTDQNALIKELEDKLQGAISKSSDDIGRRFLAKERALLEAINTLEGNLSSKINSNIDEEKSRQAANREALLDQIKAIEERVQEEISKSAESLKSSFLSDENAVKEGLQQLDDRLNKDKASLENLIENTKSEFVQKVSNSSEETEAKIKASVGDLESRLSQETQTLRNKLIVFGRDLDEKLENVSGQSEELDSLKEIVKETQNRLDEESKRNSTSFMQAQEQLEERLAAKINSSHAYAQASRESINKYGETLRDHLIETKTHNSDLDKQLGEYKSMVLDLQQKLESTSDMVNQKDSAQAEHKSAIEEKLQILQDTQNKIERLEANLAETRQAVVEKAENDEATFQHFNRTFTKAHIEGVQKDWIKPLNLNMRPASIAYLAKRITTIESRLKGRLATTIEAAVLRTLVALSVQGKSIDILEIGSLFGTGVAMIHDRVKTNYEKTHITIIDPLEGYYGNNALDIATGEKVNKEVLSDNLATAQVPESDYTLLQGFSTEDDIIKAASKKAYDVLIIDGDHSLAGVKADFVNYAPFVKRGGYIIVDDYGTPDWPEIQKYVDEELVPRSDISLVGSMWRTAVFRVIKKVNT